MQDLIGFEGTGNGVGTLTSGSTGVELLPLWGSAGIGSGTFFSGSGVFLVFGGCLPQPEKNIRTMKVQTKRTIRLARMLSLSEKEVRGQRLEVGSEDPENN